MEKIVCDICGTKYPTTENCCPVCGCSQDFSMEDFADDSFSDVKAEPVQSSNKRRNREIFDFDEVNQEKTNRKIVEEDDEDEEEYEEEPRTNVFLVIILVILIVLLLLTAGFFFLRYFLPNMIEAPEQTEAVVTTVPVQTEATESIPLRIPCTDLVIPGGKVELGKDGKWLMNVQVFPADTTDVLTYVSEDESVAVVSEDGTVTAVGEGKTAIVISCGTKQIRCNVSVDYTIGIETVPAVEIPAMQVENEDATEDTVSTEPQETVAVQASEPTEETKPAEADQESAAADQTLKLKKTDITISSNYTSVKLELDCDIAPEDIKWFTMDSTIAIVHDGLVTSTGSGMTRIYGEYNGEQIMCIVRCIF